MGFVASSVIGGLLFGSFGLEGEGVDAVAQLGAEHAVHEPVLGDSVKSNERGCRYNRVEVMPVAADLGAGAGDAGFDALFQLLRGCGHAQSVARSYGYTE